MMATHETSEKLIGLVGNAASGKDTIALLLQEHGFLHVSLSDTVRSEIVSRGLDISRTRQTQVANEMRQLYGNGYWVDRALEDVKGHVSLTGLYAPGEGRHLMDIGGTLVGVAVAQDSEEDLNVRYERIVNRRDGARDKLSWEDFLAANYRENSGTEPYQANVASLLSMAHFTICNTGDTAALRASLDTLVEQLSGGIQ